MMREDVLRSFQSTFPDVMHLPRNEIDDSVDRENLTALFRRYDSEAYSSISVVRRTVGSRCCSEVESKERLSVKMIVSYAVSRSIVGKRVQSVTNLQVIEEIQFENT